MSSFQSDCIVQNSVYSIYTRFQVPKLYRYVHEGKWQKIPRRCKTRPREAKFVHKYAPCDTALHRLLRAPDESWTERFLQTTNPALQNEIAQLRLEAICALVEANPSIVSTPDCFGRTPLHLACINREYSEGAAEILLGACPAAASIHDTFGKTPLQYLLAEEQHVPPSLIQKFITVTPNALMVSDRRVRMPVDIAKVVKGEQSNVVSH